MDEDGGWVRHQFFSLERTCVRTIHICIQSCQGDPVPCLWPCTIIYAGMCTAL